MQILYVIYITTPTHVSLTARSNVCIKKEMFVLIIVFANGNDGTFFCHGWNLIPFTKIRVPAPRNACITCVKEIKARARICNILVAQNVYKT